jgi:hypothetical protein
LCDLSFDRNVRPAIDAAWLRDSPQPLREVPHVMERWRAGQ